MSDEDIQQQDDREESMAGGPVSAGALNTSEKPDGEILTSNETGIPSTEKNGQEDYDKLIRSDAGDAMMGNDMEAGQGGNSTGGVSMSDDTLSGGNSSAGDVFGLGSSTGRGSMADTDVDATTDTIDELDENS